MRFNFTVAAVVAMAASVFAAAGDATADFDIVRTPAADSTIDAGKNFKIVWEAPAKYAAATVTFQLLSGDNDKTLQPDVEIAKGLKNNAGSYDWAVPATLGDKKLYGIRVTLDSDPNTIQFSPRFKIQKAAGATSGSASGVTTILSTTAVGIKTITLSTTTPTPTSAARNTSSVANTTAPATSSWTMATSTPVELPTTTTGTPVPTKSTGAAASFGASSMAAAGGLLIAFFAL